MGVVPGRAGLLLCLLACCPSMPSMRECDPLRRHHQALHMRHGSECGACVTPTNPAPSPPSACMRDALAHARGGCRAEAHFRLTRVLPITPLPSPRLALGAHRPCPARMQEVDPTPDVGDMEQLEWAQVGG